MELLAPAGTFDCVVAAADSGADAVYFAGQAFGARSFAGNLTDDEIFRAVDYCRLRNVRTYITVNTLVYDREFKDLERFTKIITKAGADGVIVQDLGVMEVIRQISPDIEIHASTQMTVHSLDGVRHLEKNEVSRVVLSRELSAREIEYITKNASAETEVFVHGAMCMSYSGQCLMSSVIGGRSGNRGKCAQPCRLLYQGNDKKSGFYLSLKDMSLAEHISELERMGVASLKIEGRMKGETYVSAVVSTYRRLIDEKRIPAKKEKDYLNSVFYRGGLTDGYYTDKIGPKMFAFDKPDNPYLKNSFQVEKFEERKRKIHLYSEIFEGKKPYLKLTCGDITVEEYGEKNTERAEKRPLDKADAEDRLCKLGDTPFEASFAEVKMGGSPFVPVSVLNELRRKGIEKLESAILAQRKNLRIDPSFDVNADLPMGKKEIGFTCSVLTAKQINAVKKYDFKRIFVPLFTAAENLDVLCEVKDKVVLSLPVIIREKEREDVKNTLFELKNLGFNKVEISTVDGLEISKDFEVYASHRMNITNSYALKSAKDRGIKCVCLSTELNVGQMRDIKKSTECEIAVYGRIPLMLTENCILKNVKECPCKGNGYITDRTGRVLPIVKDGKSCRNIVLNSVPLYTADKIDDIKKCGADGLRLMFTTEEADEVHSVCKAYTSGISESDIEFTRLRMFKGALD